MKNIKYIFTLFILLSLASCEEVIDIDLDTAAPRLVVEASINWKTGTAGNDQLIKLTTTTGYYNTEIPAATGAVVFITNSTNTQFDFTENPGTGQYVCTNFIPQTGETYTLTINYKSETYTAIEQLFATPVITHTTQTDDGGFLGDNTEVRFFYQDDGSATNFYMNSFNIPIIPYPDYDVNDDEFSQGNEMFGIFSDEDLKAGDVLDIKLYGISERYYNYMSKLLEVTDGSGGPFQTPPSIVRGNVVNQSNKDNYPLGYFRLGEVSSLQYTVQ